MEKVKSEKEGKDQWEDTCKDTSDTEDIDTGNAWLWCRGIGDFEDMLHYSRCQVELPIGDIEDDDTSNAWLLCRALRKSILCDCSYTWLTRLEDTEAHWQGWYKGLSDLFLSSPVPKILVLAGTERLDRSLTIGQMQGKFQMVVLRNTGHAAYTLVA
ncbi:hypothetical protein L7F22_049829 [Adiantum nelumboides]|nr:hypothetical protein [Adiantum nelumboides]